LGFIGVRGSLTTSGDSPALPLSGGAKEPVFGSGEEPLFGSTGVLMFGRVIDLVAIVGWSGGLFAELWGCDRSWHPCRTKIAVSTIITRVTQNKGAIDQWCIGDNALLLSWSSISLWF
jgi:hypothetical protein